MTYRFFLKVLAAIAIPLAFMLAVSVAATAAPKWKSEVYIYVWCYDPDALSEMHKHVLSGNTEVVAELAERALRERRCGRSPSRMYGIAFKPSEVVEELPDAGNGPILLVKGNVVNADDTIGEEAYTVIAKVLISRWQLEESTKIPPFQPQYHKPGQNI